MACVMNTTIPRRVGSIQNSVLAAPPAPKVPGGVMGFCSIARLPRPKPSLGLATLGGFRSDTASRAVSGFMTRAPSNAPAPDNMPP